MEIWKDVVGFERAYQVSNLGRVKSEIRKGVIEEKLLNGGVITKQQHQEVNNERIKV